ncbi:hypothetical protein NDU88_006861 [Pleurodeles waltl]|uniref:Uncharacterized protein n=1 Tax=Pleurodeles waltl TaxID=8319 RepID=A0AAV7WYS5_PLEWA|nr:hypothetical protein NDU88_006861 [Pleurodeles waltl]
MSSRMSGYLVTVFFLHPILEGFHLVNMADNVFLPLSPFFLIQQDLAITRNVLRFLVSNWDEMPAFKMKGGLPKKTYWCRYELKSRGSLLIMRSFDE